MQVGDIVDGRYRLLDLLGEGAAGKVFRCEDLGRNNMFVALKLLHAKDPRWENFFRREFEVLSRLHHPNLVSVYDFGPAPEENTWYFTQELVVGKPLLETVAGKKIDEVIALFVEICRALEFIHGHGVLHRDLKPANILVQQHAEPGERVRVLDFGLWRELDPTPQRGARWAGTPPYLASEVLKGFGHSVSADLYAVGVTLFQVLTRKLPHGRGTPQELLQARKTPAPDLTGMVKGELAQLITRLLDEVPESRPQSAAEVAAIMSTMIPNHAVGMPIALGRARLVGRDEEKQKVGEIVDAAKDRKVTRPRLVIIEGEDGIGKSRFATELKAEVQLKGGRSAVGTCIEDVRWNYRPIVDLCRALAPLAGRAQLTSSEKVVLERLMPELSANPGAADDAAMTKADRARFHEDAAELFVGLGGPTVCVLIIEDVGYCDPASAELIAALIRRSREATLLIVVTHNEENGPIPKEILDAAAGEALRVQLSPLPKDDVTKLLRGLLAVPEVPDAFSEMMAAHSRGSPRLVEELLALLIDRGDLQRSENGWRFDHWKGGGAGSAPVLGVLTERVQRLKPDERTSLFALAVFNRPSGPKQIAAVAKLDVQLVRQALTTCEAQGLIRVVGEDDGRPRFIFRHPAVRDALIEELKQSGKLADWHRTCAQILEERVSGNLAPMAETLAHHYEDAGDDKRAVELYLVASQYAVDSFAFADALALGRRASRVSLRAHNASDITMRCDLAVGRAMVLSGFSAEARAFLEGAAAREGAQRFPEVVSETHLWLVRACIALGVVDAGVRAVDRALGSMDAAKHPAAVARLLVGRALLRAKLTPTVALADADRALELWKNKPSVDDQLRLDEVISIAARHAGDLQRAVKAASRRVQLAQAEARLLDEVTARRLYASVLTAIGDRLEARRQLNQALELAIRNGYRLEEGLVTRELGDQLYLSGAYKEAIARYQKAATMAAQFAQITDRAQCLRWIGRCYYARGEYDRALDHLRAALDSFDKQGDVGAAIGCRCDVALALLAKGSADDAQEALKLASKKLPPQGLEIARAETYAAQGFLFLQRQDYKRSRLAFLHAVAIYRRLKEQYALAEALVGYAQLLLRAREPRRANRLTKRAESTFASMDARGQLKRIQPLINATDGLAATPRDGARVPLR
jgi:tetratricopeptide (TPR) repeat protein